MSYLSFQSKWLGKRTDPDSVFNYQCVDLILQYLIDEYRITSGVWGNAIDYWNKPTPTLLKSFYKIRGSAAKRGDIVVFKGLTGNPYGHIGIATGNINDSFVEVLEQNGADGSGSGLGGNAVRKRYIGRDRVAGLLRHGQAPRPPVTYKIISGDTLSGIAFRHKTTVQQLIDWNKKKYPTIGTGHNSFIGIGWTIRVK